MGTVKVKQHSLFGLMFETSNNNSEFHTFILRLDCYA